MIRPLKSPDCYLLTASASFLLAAGLSSARAAFVLIPRSLSLAFCSDSPEVIPWPVLLFGEGSGGSPGKAELGVGTRDGACCVRAAVTAQAVVTGPPLQSPAWWEVRRHGKSPILRFLVPNVCPCLPAGKYK